jgi:hypothetical protein
MIKAVLPPTHPKCGVTAGMVSARIMIDYTTAAGSIYHYLPIHSPRLTYTRQRLSLHINVKARHENGEKTRLWYRFTVSDC